jgi:hypothetical protein
VTEPEDLHRAHNTVAARISADSAAALRRIVERIDNGDVEYDGFGGKIVNHD